MLLSDLEITNLSPASPSPLHSPHAVAGFGTLPESFLATASIAWLFLVTAGCCCRFDLGLAEQPPQSVTEDDAYQDVKPRWPLTNLSDSRGLPKGRGLRKKRLHPSLTEITAEAMSCKSQKIDTTQAVQADQKAAATVDQKIAPQLPAEPCT